MFCDEYQTREEYIEAMQELINTGTAWRLEGAVGRECMALIEAGECMLGEHGNWDYWDNYVPSRYEVKAGTKGSPEYCEEMRNADNA